MAYPAQRTAQYIDAYPDTHSVPGVADILANYGAVFGDAEIFTRVDPDDKRPFTRLTNEQIFATMAAQHISTLIRDYAETAGGWWFVVCPLMHLASDNFTATIMSVIPGLASAAPPYSSAPVVELREEHFAGQTTAWHNAWTVKGSSLQFEQGVTSLALQIGEVANSGVRRAKERVEVAMQIAKNHWKAYNVLTTKAQTQDELVRRANRFYGGMSVNPTFLQEYLDYADQIMASEDRHATVVVVPNRALSINYFARLNNASYDRILDESTSNINLADTRLQPQAYGRTLYRSENWKHIRDGQQRGDFLEHRSTTARWALISAAYAATFVTYANFRADLMQSIQVHDMRGDMPRTIGLLDAIKQGARFDTKSDTGALLLYHQQYADAWNNPQTRATLLTSDLPPVYQDAKTGEWIHDTMLYAKGPSRTADVGVAATIGDLTLSVFSLDLQDRAAEGLRRSVLQNGNISADVEATIQKLGYDESIMKAFAGAVGADNVVLTAVAQTARPSSVAPRNEDLADDEGAAGPQRRAEAARVAPAALDISGGPAQAKRREFATRITNRLKQLAFMAISAMPLTLRSLEALQDNSRGNTVLPLSVLHFDYVTLQMGDLMLAEPGIGRTFYNTVNVRSGFEPDHDIIKGTAEFRLAAHVINPAGLLFVRDVFFVGYVAGCTTNVVTSREEFNERLRNKYTLDTPSAPSGFFFVLGGSRTIETMPSNTVWLNGVYDERMYYGTRPVDAGAVNEMLDCTRYYSIHYGFYTLNDKVVPSAYSLFAAAGINLLRTCAFRSFHTRPDIATGRYTDEVLGDGPLPERFLEKMGPVFSGAKMVDQHQASAIAY